MVEIKQCITYPYLIIPIFKILLEAIGQNLISENEAVFKELLINIASINLSYGLTFDPNDEENMTTINKDIIKMEGVSRVDLMQWVDQIEKQSYEVRRSICVHV